MVILRTRNKITDFFMILAWASPFKTYRFFISIGWQVCGHGGSPLWKAETAILTKPLQYSVSLQCFVFSLQCFAFPLQCFQKHCNAFEKHCNALHFHCNAFEKHCNALHFRCNAFKKHCNALHFYRNALRFHLNALISIAMRFISIAML